MSDCPFQPMQLVKAVNNLPKGYQWQYPWKIGEILLFMGEIKQMPGHCLVVNRAGKIYWGYHTDGFIEPSEDEV